MFGFDIGVNVRALQRFIAKQFLIPFSGYEFGFHGHSETPGVRIFSRWYRRHVCYAIGCVPILCRVYPAAHQSPLRRSPSSSVRLSAISLMTPSCVSPRDVIEVFSKRKVDYGEYRLRTF